MRHCGSGSGCSQHYLNYDAKVYNSSLPLRIVTFRPECSIAYITVFVNEINGDGHVSVEVNNIFGVWCAKRGYICKVNVGPILFLIYNSPGNSPCAAAPSRRIFNK